MANINTNIIMQAGAAVANATNKAAGLSAATPEPGSIISAIQLVNGGRAIGPAALAHFTESVRNKLLSLLVSMETIQSGSGTPSLDNVRPISGRTGLNVYVSPTQDAADATIYAVDWTSEAGTVYHGTVDPVSGQLTVDWAMVVIDGVNKTVRSNGATSTTSNAWFEGAVGKAYGESNIISDRFSAGLVGFVPGAMTGRDNSIGIELRLPADITNTNEALNQWFADNPTQLCYELATPLTYQLTPQDVITLVGDNYIWSDSGDVTITE